MPVRNLIREDAWRVVALASPLAARFYEDGTAAAPQRLLLFALALGIAYGWALLFARRAGRPAGPGPLPYAMIFVFMLPGPVAWGGAVLALSFGAVFGREMFGGRAILPPALVGLAFAIFSFPDGGFEARNILLLSPDPLFAAACLPGAALLMWKNALSWQVAAGALLGLAAAGLAMGVPAWWDHAILGAFAAGVLFLAAAPGGAPKNVAARWLLGILVGALVILIRTADPGHPDGVVFAVLLGALFAPLLDRALGWRPRHG